MCYVSTHAREEIVPFSIENTNFFPNRYNGDRGTLAMESPPFSDIASSGPSVQLSSEDSLACHIYCET